jgi:N-methylhydantoinase A
LVAREIGIPDVIVPPYSGMFSALGATLGQIRHEVVQTLLREVPDLSADEIESGFAQLAVRARTLLAREPAGIGKPCFDRFVDARFTGQMFELKLAFGPNPITPAGIEAAFRTAYRAEYGFDLAGADVQVVNLRLLATQSLGIATDAILAERTPIPAATSSKRRVSILGRDGTAEEVPFVIAAEAGGLTIEGPAIISHQGSTVWLERGQFGAAADDGRLLIKPGSRA